MFIKLSPYQNHYKKIVPPKKDYSCKVGLQACAQTGGRTSYGHVFFALQNYDRFYVERIQIKQC